MIKHEFIFFISFGSLWLQKTSAVPPAACFEKFRWDDCGQPPKPVMYYYKSGSRCEVGLWKGCLPNMNMFVDEYECVRTCIFADRAGAEDYHKSLDMTETTWVEADGITDSNSTNIGGNSTDVDSTGSTPGSGDSTGGTPESGNSTPTGVSEGTGAKGTGGDTEAAGETTQVVETNAAPGPE